MSSSEKRNSTVSNLVVILIVLGILAILAGLILPALSKAKARAQRVHLRLEKPVTLPADYQQRHNTESYDYIVDNPFLSAHANPLSTFSIDVDTAAYSNIRRFLNAGKLPPKDSVRIEELLNYFPYKYLQPTNEHPVSILVEGVECPWNPEHRLVRVALKGREVAPEKRPVCNLVFLIDVSGSMDEANKLPLLQRSLELLVEKLSDTDRVAIVVYAGNSGLVLDSTACKDRDTILRAVRRLKAGGSTNGDQGLELAYATAVNNYIKGGANRVILCTDGDFNVGVTSQSDLVRMIKDKSKSGVFLTVLGFGMGNYKDSTLEQLADLGNGNYGYVDSLDEAKKLLAEQLSETLITIAKDVKIQIEFNPAQASAYRLLGYENRLLRKEDFNDDSKDAGDMGAGHTVTALYEVVPANRSVALPTSDPLKYQLRGGISTPTTELLTLKLRYKAVESESSQLLTLPFTDQGTQISEAGPDMKFAAAVASFGMVLRDSPHKGNSSYALVKRLAQEGQDGSEHRAEFLKLIDKAESLQAGKMAQAGGSSD